ncbi:hypothetical protein C0995_000304 [Termitomyces sp. Mi166|nr:hypothetical protein C0995_000304 [Termitomyces sp. Mi166\
MLKVKDAQLITSFSLKSRSAPTVEGVVNEDCLEPPNSESIHQPILVDLKEEESVSTPLNPLSSQANSIPLEQLPQPGDNTGQPQNDDAQNPSSPELSNDLDIKIIGAAPFAQILWESA